MKNSAKKILSMLLVLCMLAALTVSAFAAGPERVGNYLMLGDSVAIYCGASETEDTQVYINPNLTFRRTYSERLKQDPQLGITSICSCAHSGWRVQEALYALGGSNYTADYILRYGGEKTTDRMESLSRNYYIKALEDADLITINLGSNNIMQAFVYGLYTAFEQQGIAFSGSKLDEAAIRYLQKLEKDVNDVDALVNLLALLETTERGIVLLKNALKMMPNAITEFQKSWEELMALIHDKNPDVNVIVMGLYNPVGELVKHTITGSLSVDGLGKSFLDTAVWLIKETTDPMVDAMNLYLRGGSNRFATKYVFLDNSKVDLAGSADGVHMGETGHEYVYNRMKDIIVTKFLPDSVPATKTTPAGLLGKFFSGLKNLF